MTIKTLIIQYFLLIEEIMEVDVYILIESFSYLNFSWPLLAFMKNSLFHFIALLLYWKRPLSALIKNSLYQGFFTLSKKGLFRFITLLKTAFIEDFSLYCLIKNGLYRPLLKTAFLLYCFIENGLNWPLSKKAFSLYRFI